MPRKYSALLLGRRCASAGSTPVLQLRRRRSQLLQPLPRQALARSCAAGKRPRRPMRRPGRRGSSQALAPPPPPVGGPVHPALRLSSPAAPRPAAASNPPQPPLAASIRAFGLGVASDTAHALGLLPRSPAILPPGRGRRGRGLHDRKLLHRKASPRASSIKASSFPKPATPSRPSSLRPRAERRRLDVRMRSAARRYLDYRLGAIDHPGRRRLARLRLPPRPGDPRARRVCSRSGRSATHGTSRPWPSSRRAPGALAFSPDCERSSGAQGREG